MDNLFTFGILVVGFLGLIVPGLAVSAFVSATRRKTEVESLRLRVLSLESALAGGPATRPAPSPVAEKGPDAAAGPAAVAAASETPSPVAADGATAPQAAAQRAAGEPAAGSAAGGSGLDRFERQVTSRWFVWLGAATLGLAGVFLVKEAAERGWLGPGVRVSLGFLTGLVLVAAGEWVRRRFPADGERGRADYVPPALSSGGFLFCYASIYAAGQLFGYLTPTLTFAGMAGVVLAAGLTAMLHGPFLALLSAVGGFVLPALIATREPNGWVLFFYLAAVSLGCLEIARRRPWTWLGWIALGGSVAWALVWVDMPRSIAPTGPLGFFLFFTVACFGEYAPRIAGAFPPGDARYPKLRDPRVQALAAGIVVALLAFVLARVDDYGVTGIGTLALVGGAMVFNGRRFARLDWLALVAAVTTVAALALWHLPSILKSYTPVVVERGMAGLGWAPHLPPEATSFLTACIAFGAAYAGVAFTALWGARRPVLWACVSTATPLLLLVAAYGRVAKFDIDLHWSASALVVAGAFLAAAARVAPYRDSPGMGNVLGIYAGAVTGAIALAMAMGLRDAWLSVALALELPALAWIHRRLPLESLRVIAGIVAAVLCGRLALNPDVFTYVTATAIGDHWPIYGYGIPLAATYLAWRDFARREPDWLDAWLRALCFALAALLVAFELRATMLRADPAVAMAASHEAMGIIGWLALAAGLHQPVGRGERLVRWVRRCLLVFGAIAIAVFPLAVDNPLWRSNLPVGEWPVANALLLAYATPAGLLLVAAYFMRATETRALLLAAAALALLLGLAWVTLETRHAFRGSDLASGSMSDAESYAYSAMWLVYAGVLLAGGLWSKSQALRIGSLVVVMAAVLKVFLVDMDDLTGLWRVASFFGLGLALVGIGFLYQRLVFVRAAPVEVPPAPASAPTTDAR